MAATRNSPPPDLARRVGEFLETRLAAGAGALPAVPRLCVGLSGGCDSSVLLHLVAALRPRYDICAVHVHHGLSPNADTWAGHCAALCTGLAIPLRLARVGIAPQGEGLEAAARNARYQAFAAALDAFAADVLLLGQHRGDQAETLLFNLLRGSGITGLGAIPAERTFHSRPLWRPLLATTRAEIEAWARAHALVWIDDESNADTALTRNHLRHDLLPLLAARFPAAEAALARSAAHCAEAGELLDQLAELDWTAVADGDSARWPALRQLPPARLKNLLRYRLRHLGWQPPSSERLEEFTRQLQQAAPDRHPELQLPAGRIRAGQGRVRWLAN
ncbi:MAG: tRNA lysidine(34) synthetase TilS [Azonexus sp.]|nr:tRNA lysidine(34) synthetase TilS [Azonexus sp.]MCK6413207.1 tRNA lysidine(34) synthetase TilS [Azonexus sp.]